MAAEINPSPISTPARRSSSSSPVARGRYKPATATSSSTMSKTDKAFYAGVTLLVALCAFPPGFVFALATICLLGFGSLMGLDSLVSKAASAYRRSRGTAATKPAKPKEVPIPLSDDTKKEFVRIYEERHGVELKQETLKITASVGDKGGHGGNLQASARTEDGREVHFFLKPVDEDNPVELNNYQYINGRTDLQEQEEYAYTNKRGEPEPFQHNHMAITYDDPIDIKVNGKMQAYMIMDSVCIGSDGKKKEVVADIKLSGKVSGINPIASWDEIHGTNRTKGRLDFWQMDLGSQMAPHFKFTTGHKFLRFFNYWRSEANLKKIFAKANEAQLIALKEQLVAMKKAMEDSNIAFIGSSLLLLWDESRRGPIEAKLIDPAHIEIEDKDDDYPDVYANRAEYHQYRESNDLAMNALIRVVDEAIAKKSRGAAS